MCDKRAFFFKITDLSGNRSGFFPKEKKSFWRLTPGTNIVWSQDRANFEVPDPKSRCRTWRRLLVNKSDSELSNPPLDNGNFAILVRSVKSKEFPPLTEIMPSQNKVVLAKDLPMKSHKNRDILLIAVHITRFGTQVFV